MRRFLRVFLVCSFFLSGAAAANAQEQFFYVQDKTGNWKISDLLGGAFVFSPLESGKSNFGFFASVFWVRADFAAVKTDTQRVLELADPLMDEIDFWLVREGKIIEHQRTGYRLPFSERPAKNRNFVFPLNLSADSTVYLRLASSDHMNIPLKLWARDEWAENNSIVLLLFGLYFGIVITAALYNLFMYAVLRLPSFLAYTCYILTFGFFMASQNGLAYEFLWPQGWDNHYVPQNITLFMMALNIFLWFFYQNAAGLKRLRHGIAILGAVFFALFVTSFFLQYSSAIELAAVVTLGDCVFLICVSVVGSLHGSRQARYTLLAFSFPTAGGFLYWLKITGCIASNLFSDYGLQMGSALEIVLLSLGIAELVNYEIREANLRLMKTQSVTIFSLAYLAELRDQGTGEHLTRTAQYVELLVKGLRKNRELTASLTPQYEYDLVQSTPLHDIGKVGVPDIILLKPGKLDPSEFETMKTHCEIGARVLMLAREKLGFQTFLDMAIELILGHHERWDGTGYPFGLKARKIPLSARIMALADVYDALTQKRSYKEALPHEQAKELILASRGRHFDPQVVDAFLEVETQFKIIAETLS